MLSEKRKAYLAEWRKKNRDKTRESQRKYYATNKIACNERVRKCHTAKKDYYTDKVRDWAIANPLKVAAIRQRSYLKNAAKEIERVRRRQKRIRQGEGLMSVAELVEAQGLYDFCHIFKGYEVDHIIPLNGKNISGLHVLSNLQVLPVSENRRKGSKLNYVASAAHKE